MSKLENAYETHLEMRLEEIERSIDSDFSTHKTERYFQQRDTQDIVNYIRDNVSEAMAVKFMLDYNIRDCYL